MKKTPVIVIAVALLWPFLASACVPEPVSTEITPVLREVTPAFTAKAAWEEEWERTLAAARREGTVFVYTLYAAEWRKAFAEAMSKKYGISLDALTGRADELAERIIREQNNKVYHADVGFVGQAPFKTLQRAGILESLEKVIILPEVKHPKVWWRGELSWLDPDTKTALNYREQVSPPWVINTDLVKFGELKSWNDLLDPKWKGRILVNDPTAAGGGQITMAMLAYSMMDWDYINRLLKQELTLSRDNRLLVEWVARGKYPIVIGPRKEEVVSFVQAGAPIAFLIPSEGTHLSGLGFVAYFKNSRHPNAAKVFINFFLSKEGQTLSSKASGYQSSRIDVPTDYLEPSLVRQQGTKYISGIDKGFLEKEIELRDKVVQIFKPLSR